MSTRLSEQDMAAAIAFVEGQLDAAQREDFERRMGADACLASAVEQLLDGEALLERWRRTPRALRGTGGARPASWARRAIVAAGLSLAAGLVVRAWLWPAPHTSGVELELAVLSGQDSFRQFRGQHAVLADLVAPELDGVPRGAPDADPATPGAVVLERVRSLEAQLAQDALAARVTRIESEKFFATVRLEQPASVLVLACSRPGATSSATSGQDGPLRLLFPDPRCEDDEFARRVASTRLDAGLHQLPGSRVRGDADSLRFASVAPEVFNCRPGKDAELAVFVAVTPAALDARAVTQLVRELADGLPGEHQARVAQLRARLAAAGYAVGELTVVNPRLR